MKYTVAYEKSSNGFGAYAPNLPGLGVVGSTLEETRKLIREGIEAHIQVLLEFGEADQFSRRDRSANLGIK